MNPPDSALTPSVILTIFTLALLAGIFISVTLFFLSHWWIAACAEANGPTEDAGLLTTEIPAPILARDTAIFGASPSPNLCSDVNLCAIPPAPVFLPPVFLPTSIPAPTSASASEPAPELLTQCAWCRRFLFHGKWLDFSASAERPVKKHITHGICPACVRKYNLDATAPASASDPAPPSPLSPPSPPSH